MSDQSTQSSDSGTHKAGLFDIRFIIGGVIGIYGVILTVMGLFADHADKTKAAGININLWAGLVMVVVALAFGTWARVRPIVVPDHVETDEDDHRPAH